MTTDSAAFHDFEFAGWQNVAHRYHDTFATVTVQCIPALLDAAGIRRGSRVLDLACGPGYAAGAAALRAADVLGVDFSSAMVGEARMRFPTVRFDQADAEDLQLVDASFDAAVMNFGMLHLGRPERAIAEVHRVLQSGGRFAFTVWDTPDKCAGFGIVLAAIRKHGDMAVPLPPGPPFFRFSDPLESRRALEEAGFTDVRTMTVAQVWRLARPNALFDVMMNASVRNAALLRAQPPDVLTAIQAEMQTAVEQFRTGDGYGLAMPAVLTSCTRR